MFDPEAIKLQKQAKALKRQIISALQQKAYILIPVDLQEGLQISVKEMACGDPTCAPIDTIFQFVFPNGRGIYGMPMAPEEIEDDDLIEYFPDEPTLRGWSIGEHIPWPKREVPEPPNPNILRFMVGSYVECRVGPDPVTGWAPGRVKTLLYREPNWPEGYHAPYQIELDDGRLIFAPQDTDKVIRPGVVPPPSEGPPGAGSSSSGAI